MAVLSVDKCHRLQAGWVSHDYNLGGVKAVEGWQGTPEALKQCLDDCHQGKLVDGHTVLSLIGRVNLDELPLKGRYPCHIRLLKLSTNHLAVMIAEQIAGWGYNPLWQGLFDANGQPVAPLRHWEATELRRLAHYLPHKAEAVVYLSGLFAAIKWLDGDLGSLAKWVQPEPLEAHRELFRPLVQKAVNCWRGPLLVYVQNGAVEHRWIGDQNANAERYLA